MSRARVEFKFHCQMLEDLVIGAEELGNGLDVGRPRWLAHPASPPASQRTWKYVGCKRSCIAGLPRAVRSKPLSTNLRPLPPCVEAISGPKALRGQDSLRAWVVRGLVPQAWMVRRSDTQPRAVGGKAGNGGGGSMVGSSLGVGTGVGRTGVGGMVGGGGVTRSDVGACRVLISDIWACGIADI